MRILPFLCSILQFAAITTTQQTLNYQTALLGTISPWNIFKRDGNCPEGYGSCAYMGAPSFCCKSNANCAIDPLGHAACCPQSAQCTGTIKAGAFVVNGGSVATAASHTATLVAASYSVVPNPYYPFQAIPTTYVNAAMCSQAYTNCQSDMAHCTAYLAGSSVAAATAGLIDNGVTISAPNGGVTVRASLLTPTVTLPSVAAASICTSLSLLACSGLQVTACTVFGNGNGNAANGQPCAPAYTAAFAGAAIGIVGQVLWS